MGRRTKARECAVQMLYQWEITRAPIEDVVASFWQVRSTVDETRAMAERLTRGTWSQLAEIDAAISQAVRHWRVERLAAVDKSILRVATYELVAEPQTPAAVILDEAVDVAKRFGDTDSSAFVNGVLDAVCRMVRGEGACAPRDTKGAAEHGS